MEQVSIWYLTDNEHGEKLSTAIKGMGLSVTVVKGFDLENANIHQGEINLFIFDFQDILPQKVVEKIVEEKSLSAFLKFVLVNKKDVKDMTKLSYNIMHLEFISKPVEKREFLLLLEKSIIVEKYHEIMKTVSKEAVSRIETYEGVLDINRRNVFESEKEKKAFERILMYEKNLQKEQAQLNKAIKDFTLLRQFELFDMKNRIKAEEMLADLRRKELMDANNIIHAQESLIDFSVNRLEDANKIINASEQVAELSRAEAIEMRQELKDLRELKEDLTKKMAELIAENNSLKDKHK